MRAPVPPTHTQPGSGPPRPPPRLAQGFCPRGSVFFSFLPHNNCHLFVGNLPLATSVPPLTAISLSTLGHCPFHSGPPPLSSPLTHVDYLSVFCCGRSLSGEQLFLSAQPTLCTFTVSSSCSLTFDCRFSSLSVPLYSPLIPTHSIFTRLCSLPQFG